MKIENKSTIAYVILGIILGYISFLLKNNLTSLGLMLVVLYVSPFVLNKILKINEKIKWYLSNGGWIYIFIWFITWTIFYNCNLFNWTTFCIGV